MRDEIRGNWILEIALRLDRPLHPFRQPHPPVIPAYADAKAARLAAEGNEPFRKPPGVP